MAGITAESKRVAKSLADLGIGDGLQGPARQHRRQQLASFAALKSLPAAAYGTLEAVFSFAGSCSCKILCIYTISAKSCYCGRMDGRLAVPSGSAYPGRLGMNWHSRECLYPQEGSSYSGALWEGRN